MKNIKGQVISIVAFFVIVLSVLVLGMLLMSFVNTILNPYQVAMANLSNQSGQAVKGVNDAFNKWWDVSLVLLFFLNNHPLFLNLYHLFHNIL